MNRRHFQRSFRPGQVRSDEAEDIRDEIGLYLELRTEELIAEGMPPAEAARVARERFGDAARIEAELRRKADRHRSRTGWVTTMGAIKRDLAYAVRSFRRNPGFTLVAVLTLGLAMGGATAIYSVVDAALLQAMPFEDHEELVFVNGYHLSNGEIAIRGASYPEFRDWHERSGGISPMAAIAGMGLALSGDGEAESLRSEVVTEEYFDIVGVEPALGRGFTAEEHGAPGAFAVALISDGLWQRRYGGAPDVLGRTIVLNDRTFEIVGVLSAGFAGTSLNADVWLPASAMPILGFDGVLDARGSRFLSVIGRLATDAEQAQRELDVIARDLQTSFPRVHEDRFAQVQGFREAYLDTTGRLLWVLLGAGVTLLLVAAANVANLLLVRSHARTRELVLRRALGAESRRVAGQLLTESMVLAGIGGVAGLALASLGLGVLGPMIPQGVLPGYVQVELSRGTFVFCLVVLTLVGVTMGLVPAMASARSDIATTLREGGKTAAGSLRRFRAQHAFVVVQVALALVLMVGAGLLTRSFRAQLGVQTGSELEQVVAMRMSLPGARYPDSDARRLFAGELERRAAELPGARSVSVSSDLPFRGGSSGAYVFRQDAPDERIRFHRHSVSPGYLETLGVGLSSGRFIAPDDVEGGPLVGVITEAMVRRVFPEENPVGQTMYLRPGGGVPFEVIGVIEDLRYRDLITSLQAEGNSPDVFFPYAQMPSGTVELALRVEGDPLSYLPRLRELAAQVDADLPLFQVQPLSVAYRAQTATPRFAAFLMGILSSLALVLACVGIYGVLAFAVGQRSQEIAIRRAIGASAREVATRVVGDGVKLAAVGLAVGAVLAGTAWRTLGSFLTLFQVEAGDPATYATVIGAMVGVSVLAGLVPAVRAMRRDPAEALTGE